MKPQIWQRPDLLNMQEKEDKNLKTIGAETKMYKLHDL